MSERVKLTVNDEARLEAEADRAAQHAVRAPSAGDSRPALSHVPPTIARTRTRPDASVRSNAVYPAGAGRALPPKLRAHFESRFGHDFGAVRVHSDGEAARLASALHAAAFTYGRDIVFGAGRYEPQTRRGLRLLAHELAHVVQQSSASDAHRVQRKAAYGVAGPLPEARTEREEQHLVVPAGDSDTIIQREDANAPEALPGSPGDTGAQPLDAGATATPTLDIKPANKLTRGDTLNARIAFTPKSGETVNVSAWRYTTTDHGTIARSSKDADFQSKWEGPMAVSGSLEADYAVTPAGGAAGALQTLKQAITVADRTGAPWASAAELKDEVKFDGQPSPPALFNQLGRHVVPAPTMPKPTTSAIAGGPNLGLTYVTTLAEGKYVSQPKIHPDLTNPDSAFNKFHVNPGRLYLEPPAGKRKLIPASDYSNLTTKNAVEFTVPDWEAFYKKHKFYKVTATDGKTVNVDDAWWGLADNKADAKLSIRDAAAIRRRLGIKDNEAFNLSADPQGSWLGFELMQAAAILTGTRSHEYKHAKHSHRANFVAMLRALDPQRKLESAVSSATAKLDFNAKVTAWWGEIDKAIPVHDLVDEKQSRDQEQYVALSGEAMAGVNEDPDNGRKFLGSVWDITADDQMK